MSSNLPHFIQEYLVFISEIHLSRRSRSTIALLKNLQLYELRNKQIQNSIDLQKTILNKVQQKIESVSPAQDATPSQRNDSLGSSLRCSDVPVGDIVIGKYVYQNRSLKIVYIILKCWNSLVIIKTSPEGFTLEKEYEDVESFQIVKADIYESKLAISFLGSRQSEVTNLQSKSHIATKSTTETYRKAEYAIKMKQSELLVHRTITKKDFSKLRHSNVFGSNFIRTPQLDEMRILSKYSDAWLKVNGDDKVVIGVPLVNNCSERLITLRNLRGLLQCSGRGDLNYTFALYRQSTMFSTIENMTTYFDNEHTQNFDWSQCEELFLRPETFCVLIFVISIGALVEFNTLELQLFASFEVMLADKLFPQKCFLANLSFRDIFANDTYKINFHLNHMNRDLLAVISTSHKLEVLLKYNHDEASLKDYLCNKMDFSMVSLPQSHSETMHVDGCEEEIEVNVQPELFYNNYPNSLWHGTLIAITKTYNNSSVAKIFTKTQEKSVVFSRFLDIELRPKCGISNICYDNRNINLKLVQLETLLRDECKSYLKLFARKHGSADLIMNEAKDLYKEVFLMQLKTDLWLKKLKS